MRKFAPYALRAYMTFRDPKFFLIVLVSFIALSLIAHSKMAYDGDFGLTNLILSIEASTASAVLMMVAEKTAALQESMSVVQREQLTQLLSMADAHRSLMTDHTQLLMRMHENDAALLEALRALAPPAMKAA